MSIHRHFYQPHQGHALKHDPFNAIVAPRPIGWISTKASSGELNLAPYSFFNAFNYHPPIIGFASIGYKDTVKNIEQTGEFCWSLVTESLAQAMNQTSATLPSHESEFDFAGLELGESNVIDVPHVAASPSVLECRKSQIIQLTGADGKLVDTWMVMGEVVGVHIDTAFIVDGVYNTALAKPVLRGGGAGDYFKIDPAQKFTLSRP
ncbi:MAG: flavin reductase family protein [Alteromonadaceae bacterium]|uniref:Flavoprotein oxygenase n=2 Tax=Paraglaciecola mesophila TaxID=197222 RepID=K6XZ03_9ALTE|nr:flavin reductase family protein [Paraglaciecola mesophila]MAD18349.1 flavin reductase family protein [Alteromonadaceae bacterium]MBB20713.1 flavin reductase family protein [Rickettsiales bacterium]GAC25799.1 flavoprotein oxygenase [Paraglaciecola mesophila KMM 241]|tara:strand:- start:1071 stop:1688 length:618 start_codon:yes stop_codon:yes gene_type:complete